MNGNYRVNYAAASDHSMAADTVFSGYKLINIARWEDRTCGLIR